MRSRRLLLLLSFTTFASVSSDALAQDWSTAGARRTRMDGLAALIGGDAARSGVHAILQSDVELRARLQIAMGSAAARWTQPTPLQMEAALEELIGESLILLEAERVRLEDPSSQQVRAQRRRFYVRAGGEARLTSLLHDMRVTQEEFDALILRRARVGAFLEANLVGIDVVTRIDLQEGYGQGNHPFVGLALDDVVDRLRDWIVDERLRSAVQRWVASLSSRTPVVRLVTYRR